MYKKIVNINDIFAMNDNLMSPSPFLYKIHDFNETDNINLADIKINVDKHYFFVKNCYRIKFSFKLINAF